MKIKMDMIEPQLRAHAAVSWAILGIVFKGGFAHAAKSFGKREQKPNLRPKVKNGIVCKEIYLSRLNGEKPMRALLYRPSKAQKNAGAVLWFHGGGYGVGSPEGSRGIIEQMIKKTGCVVLAPDYYLSAVKPYPGALNDAHLALVWLNKHAQKLGVFGKKIVVGGDSAGGGLAAGLCLKARDEGKIKIDLQVLLYPMLNHNTGKSRMCVENDPMWSAKNNQQAWQLYLGNLQGGNIPPYASPAGANNLKGLPSTCAIVGSLDIFCEETRQYVKNLQKQGVKVYFKEYKGCYHAFDAVCPSASVSRSAVDFVLNVVGKVGLA